MARRSVIPFGPQHPVLPEPLHLDLVIEDDRVIEAIPQIGFVHRGLEKLTEKRDMHQFGYIAERICGICAVGHSCGYASACERMLDIEVPGRVQYIRTILHELSRIHSHLLWLGLLADAFGFEALFYRSWTLREQILKIFESTCGGRVILSINEIGGLKHDIEDSELAGIVQTLDAMRPDYEALVHTFLDDNSCGERLHGVGVISKKDALELSMVARLGAPRAWITTCACSVTAPMRIWLRLSRLLPPMAIAMPAARCVVPRSRRPWTSSRSLSARFRTTASADAPSSRRPTARVARL
mgnify:CR=1 FL=1